MSRSSFDLNGNRFTLLEQGTGEPIVYFHGFADVHGATPDLQSFHLALSKHGRLLAPAHPGCAGSDGISEIDGMDDVLVHYLDLFDAIGLNTVTLVGTCFGGWIAAEFALRHPDRVRKLVLIGATGLHLVGAPIGDLFMLSLSKNGGDLSDLRTLLFSTAASPLARDLFPDGRASIEQEMLRYRALTFAGRIGWNPPYLCDPKLESRLRRVSCPSLVLWGEQDRLVSSRHAEAYGRALKEGDVRIVPGVGHALQLEAPEECAQLVGEFLERCQARCAVGAVAGGAVSAS